MTLPAARTQPTGLPPITASILDVVRERIGIDFSQYRCATVQRRVRNRMMSVGVRTLDEYLAFISTAEAEAQALAERLTIKVSRFYRNRAVFDLLRHDVLPRLARERRGSPLRIWSAGCGCGEEAYTLAMLLAEAGYEGIVDASDIDPYALDAAHRGVYSTAAIEELPPELAARFLEPARQRNHAVYRVRSPLRRRVRFIRHDLTSHHRGPGTPGTFAVVSCRNVLIYLQREPQERALRRLREAIGAPGVLVLGEAEWPSAAVAESLETVEHKARVFRAIGA